MREERHRCDRREQQDRAVGRSVLDRLDAETSGRAGLILDNDGPVELGCAWNQRSSELLCRQRRRLDTAERSGWVISPIWAMALIGQDQAEGYRQCNSDACA